MKKTLTIGMAVLALSLGSAAVVAAVPAANVPTANRLGEQGETQVGQGGEQGAVQNGQNGDQGEKQNGHIGDQGEKQNGQSGEGDDAATAAPKK